MRERKNRDMELRKLEQSEHSKTRSLWETVFSEDSKEFLDYYYFFKTKDNEILVIEEEGAIRSMLQLNPYVLDIEKELRQCHYIIAVATEIPYRKRGYMGKLLRRAMQEMYGRKEPFTFLMPAAEKIYTPYDFRFVYDQKQTEEEGAEKSFFSPFGASSFDGQLKRKEVLQDASIGDAGEIAVFVREHFAGEWQVYAERTTEYYQTLIFEQQSEHGGIRMLRADEKLVGIFAYGDEDGMEIREPLYLKEYEGFFKKAVFELMGERERVKLYAWDGGTKREPVIMARILHLETMLSCMRVRQGKEMDCSFAVLDSILSGNSRIWRIWGGEATGWKVRVRETEDSEGVLTIGALTSLLFGYQSIAEVAQEDHVIITEHLKVELEKLQALKNVWLNEIV